MDYKFSWTMPDGRQLNWPDITFEATFVRGGQPIYKSTMWPGAVGIHTGMRLKGWSFQQNTRYFKNDWHQNLKAAQAGGLGYTLVARKVMDTTPSFKEAVRKLSAAHYAAPSYFILAGTRPHEGVALTVDRLGDNDPNTPEAQWVATSKAGNGWNLVQTNDDFFTNKPLDDRRFLAIMISRRPRRRPSS